MAKKKPAMRYKGLIVADPVAAILRLSADLEFTLSEKLFFERGFLAAESGGWTLGRLISEARRAEVLKPDEFASLWRFAELRNMVVRWRGLLDNMLRKDEAVQKMRAFLTEIYEFVERAEAAHRSSPDQDAKYDKAFRQAELWVDAFWD